MRKSSIVACAVIAATLFAVLCSPVWLGCGVSCRVMAWRVHCCDNVMELCVCRCRMLQADVTCKIETGCCGSPLTTTSSFNITVQLVHVWVILAVHTFQWLLPTVANLLFLDIWNLLLSMLSLAFIPHLSILSNIQQTHFGGMSFIFIWSVKGSPRFGRDRRILLPPHLSSASGTSRGHQTFLVQFLKNHPYLVMASIQDWVMFLSFRYVLIRNMGGLVGSHADVCTFFQQAMLSYY